MYYCLPSSILPFGNGPIRDLLERFDLPVSTPIVWYMIAGDLLYRYFDQAITVVCAVLRKKKLEL